MPEMQLYLQSLPFFHNVRMGSVPFRLLLPHLSSDQAFLSQYVFCGAVNCPVASVLLSVELFGSAGAPYFAVACALSYLLSGYCGLYSSQTILYSKLRAEFINVRTHE